MITLGLSRAAENYLVTIYTIQKEKPSVRSIDIVKALQYSRPTISIAMRKLREHEVIEMDEHGIITMTAQGKKIAQKVYKKRMALRDLFVDLGVDAATAEKDAAKVEYDLSEDTYNALIKNWSK